MITLTTNINIDSKYGPMNYIIKYNETNSYIDNNKAIIFLSNKNKINIKLDDSSFNIQPLIRLEAYWEDFNLLSNIVLNYFPTKIKLSSIKLLFPNFSVDTYESRTRYALTINMFIGSMLICLGSYLINRLDALAYAPVEHILDNTYYEYIEMPIIDPYEIMYSDDWAEFRYKICKEPKELNNTGTVINASLYPVIESQNENIYIMMDNYTGGQNGLNLYKDKSDDFLNLKLNFIENDHVEYPYFDVKLSYNNKFNNFMEYLKETYNFSKIFKMSYIFTIRDETDIYIEIIKMFNDIQEEVTFKKGDTWEEIIYDEEGKEKERISHNLIFENWNGWKPGINIDVTLHIIGETINNNESKICGFDLPSNYLYFTKEILKYFINDENIITINKINLDDVNMNKINIDAINKIENKIIQIDRPLDAKSNIIYPVFYKTHEAQTIIIDPDATENICINLDSYKSQVKTFILEFRIEKDAVSFIELGRVPQGVIFLIVGNRLPKKLPNAGIYRILNEKSVKITDGKYKFITNL